MMEIPFNQISSEFLIQNMMNRGRQMFSETNPFIPLPHEESLRRKVNSKLRASYLLPNKAMLTKSETESGKYSFEIM